MPDTLGGPSYYLDGKGAGVAGKPVLLSTTAGTLSSGSKSGADIALVTGSGGSVMAALRAGTSPATATLTASTESSAGLSPAQTSVGFTTDEATKLGNGQDTPYVSDPYTPGLGNFVFTKRLFEFPGKGLPFAFGVTYNSHAVATPGPFGSGWRHWYHITLAATADAVTITWGDGATTRFATSLTGEFPSLDRQTDMRLSKPNSSTYELLVLASQVRYRFDASGHLLAIVDAHGNQVTLTHSGEGLSRITDTVGRNIDFTWAYGQVLTVTSPLKSGATLTFEYDGVRNLAAITDPRGGVWRFTYGAWSRMLTHVDANGNTVVTNTYDSDGRIATQTDALGRTTTFTRTTSASGTIATVRTPGGRTVTHTYDNGYNVVGVTDGAVGASAFVYDGAELRTSVRDKNGATTQLAYDAERNLTQVTDPLGTKTGYTYDSHHRATSIVDGLGQDHGLHVERRGRTGGHDQPRRQDALDDVPTRAATSRPTGRSRDARKRTHGMARDSCKP